MKLVFFKCFFQLFFVNSASGQKIWTTLFATILWKEETTSEKVFQAEKQDISSQQ